MTTEHGWWLAVGLTAVFVLRALFRETELFRLSIREGRLRVVRGRIPQRLLDDIGDVIQHVRRASISARLDSGRARVVVRGDVSEQVAQRLRNLVGGWTVAQLRTAPRPRSWRR